VASLRALPPDHPLLPLLRNAPDFRDEAGLADALLTRLPDTIMVMDRLPAGAAAAAINKKHTFTDVYLPMGAQQKKMFEAIDGKRTIAEIAPRAAQREPAKVLFEGL